MKLTEWKIYFLSHFSGHYQRGPNDTAGYERDNEIRNTVARARAWAQVENAVPITWGDAAANRCRKGGV